MSSKFRSALSAFRIVSPKLAGSVSMLNNSIVSSVLRNSNYQVRYTSSFTVHTGDQIVEKMDPKQIDLYRESAMNAGVDVRSMDDLYPKSIQQKKARPTPPEPEEPYEVTYQPTKESEIISHVFKSAKFDRVAPYGGVVTAAFWTNEAKKVSNNIKWIEQYRDRLLGQPGWVNIIYAYFPSDAWHQVSEAAFPLLFPDFPKNDNTNDWKARAQKHLEGAVGQRNVSLNTIKGGWLVNGLSSVHIFLDLKAIGTDGKIYGKTTEMEMGRRFIIDGTLYKSTLVDGKTPAVIMNALTEQGIYQVEKYDPTKVSGGLPDGTKFDPADAKVAYSQLVYGKYVGNAILDSGVLTGPYEDTAMSVTSYCSMTYNPTTGKRELAWPWDDNSCGSYEWDMTVRAGADPISAFILAQGAHKWDSSGPIRRFLYSSPLAEAIVNQGLTSETIMDEPLFGGKVPGTSMPDIASEMVSCFAGMQIFNNVLTNAINRSKTQSLTQEEAEILEKFNKRMTLFKPRFDNLSSLVVAVGNTGESTMLEKLDPSMNSTTVQNIL
ncbi:MAG: hypothetical protein JKX94_12350, partial [Sneathiella sp.]|nr:hypothetical protein [Sneathiella sp.]